MRKLIMLGLLSIIISATLTFTAIGAEGQEAQNSPPVPGAFIAPMAGNASSVVWVRWTPSTDADLDLLTYNLSLRMGQMTYWLAEIVEGTAYSWDTRAYPNGIANLIMRVSDDQSSAWFNHSDVFDTLTIYNPENSYTPDPLYAVDFIYEINGRNVEFEFIGKGGTAYYWSFGDGMGAKNETNPVHRYSSYGNYSVTLEMIAENGISMVVTKKVVVEFPYIDLEAQAITFGGLQWSGVGLMASALLMGLLYVENRFFLVPKAISTWLIPGMFIIGLLLSTNTMVAVLQMLGLPTG